MSVRQKRLDKAQMRVLFQVPFFAPGVAKLPVEWATDSECQAVFGKDKASWTAYTDGERIKWYPGFFDKCEDQELVSVLCHEVAHCMLGHVWRRPPTVVDKGDWQTWNEAVDHAVNLMLQEFSEQVTAKGLADPFPFPEDLPIFKDPAFKGLAEEVIYSRIRRNGGGGGGGGGAGQGGKGGKGGIGAIVPPSTPDPAAQQQQQTQWEGTLIQACNIARGRGDLPAGMEKFLNELVSPKVPWQEILRSWLREQCADDWNWLKPALEYDQSGFILPGMQSEKIGLVIMARDSSGSISDQEHEQFTAEEQNFLDDMRPSKLVDVHFDTKVHHVAEYSPGDTISHKRHCGGGTDFRPVFRHIEKKGVRPKCLVILTDLDGAFPDKDPGYPVMWISTVKDGKAPFGEVVYAGE